MLAYSSISQVGYIVLGIGLGTPLGIAGGLFHLFNHALAKGLLFLNSGSVQMSTGTRDLDEMGGLAKRMPVTAATNLIGSLSIAGVPPLAGFWSKLLIIMALVQAKQGALAVIAVLASVLTLWYYLIIQRKAFFGKLEERWKDVKEAPFWMTAATVILALLAIGVGVFFAAVDQGLDPARLRRAGRGPARRPGVLEILDHVWTNPSLHRPWSSSRHPGRPGQGPDQVGHRAGRRQPVPRDPLLPDGAPYAGVFEISVVAGLITVLFMLDDRPDQNGRRRPRIQARDARLPAVLRRLRR